MTSRSPHLRVLAALVLLFVLVVSGSALASPDGDDDPTYVPGNAFGTAYSIADEGVRAPRPVTDQDPDGSSVTAAIVNSDGNPAVQFTRFDSAGSRTVSKVTPTPEDVNIDELLDIRVLSDRSIVVLGRLSGGGRAYLVRLTFAADGSLIDDSSRSTPEACGSMVWEARLVEQGSNVQSVLDAARVKADGSIDSLWDCYVYDEDEDPKLDERAARQRFEKSNQHQTLVTHYPTTGDESSNDNIDASYGEDLELGPNGDPYVLVGNYSPNESEVYHFTIGEGGPTRVGDPSPALSGLPVDLAVDNQARPVVWTEHEDEEEDATRAASGTGESWDIRRLTAALQVDGNWGTAGLATITDSRLGEAYGGDTRDAEKRSFLTVRPDNRVVATGPAFSADTDRSQRSHDTDEDAVLVGLTSSGGLDEGFADGGFKPFTYAGPGAETDSSTSGGFERVGEPTLQSDGRILVPHTSFVQMTWVINRIASPPNNDAAIGVTRLRLGSTGSNTVSSRPVTPSAVPTSCGRRAISLVRADVKGSKVKLIGLVGSRLYGRKVTIQTDPKGARASGYTKTVTVRASRKTGAFSATVPRPSGRTFVSVRYRAVSGSAKSPALKLPQSLTSRTVKSAKSTITVRGRVKQSVLGKRNKVLIRRLVCGRYRTVGSARPKADGSYSVTFKASKIRGVAFYRAESKVLRRPGSKRYVIQYARAIAIRTTSQTG